ncbi:MAG: hypothetical protein Q4E38_10220 [Eubacteriales bacterium]|nr:hypothetical protein [Eubacteriales bacterium]
MSVWKNPKLIVDTLVLSQVYAAGCDIKSAVTFTFSDGKGGLFQHPWDQNFLSKYVDNMGIEDGKDGKVSYLELTQYYRSANPDGIQQPGHLHKYSCTNGLAHDPSTLFNS